MNRIKEIGFIKWTVTFVLLIFDLFAAPLFAQSDTAGSLSFESLLEADRNVTLTARITGIIKKVEVREGIQVSAGDTLLVLEDEEALSEYKRAEVRLEFAGASYESDKMLFDKDAISHIKYLESKARYAEAEAALKKAEIQLSETRIIAPFGGAVTIKEQSIEAGQLVTANKPLFSVVKFEPLKTVVYVPEQYIDRCAIGTEGEITSIYNKGLRASAVITEKSPVIDPASSTFKIKLAVKSNPGGLIPGMHVIVMLLPK